MASFSAGTTFTDGVANDVTAAKLAALVNAATPTSGLIQDRTAETTIASNDTLLVGDASDSNNLKRMTVANFAGTLPTATITSGTITTLNSTTGTITTGVIPTLTSTTLVTTGTGTAASPAIVPTGDTNTGIFFPAADTIAFSEGGAEAMRIDSGGNVIISSNKSLISNGAGGIASNTSIGSSALSSNSTGVNNTAIGYEALYSNTTGVNNTASGLQALYSNTTGVNNTASGYRALYSNSTGHSNTASGLEALYSNTTGINNTAIGYEALFSNTTGGFNTAVGYDALTNNTTGQFNVAVGPSALDSNSTGEFNVAVGPSSLGANTTGVRNVAVGYGVLAGNTTGSLNTAIGHAALDTNTTGVQNTASGYGALGTNTTGNLNTALGYVAGLANTTGTNNTFIGHGATNTTGGSTASNTIVLGNSAITTLRCQTATISALSDARDKSNIEDIPVGIEFIKDLRPVKFTWNQRDGMRVGLTDAGFIAQESLDVVNKYNANWIGLVEDENKDQLAMTPGKLIPILVKAIQQLSAKVDSLESQLASK